MDVLLQQGVKLTATNTEDELVLYIGGRAALHLYDKDETPFIAAQWRHVLRDVNVTESFDGKRLVRLLLNLRTTTESSLRERIIALDDEILQLETTIETREKEINALIYSLYGLSDDDIAMIEAG